MNTRLAKWIYFKMQDLRGIPLRAALEELERTQRLSSDALKRMQWQRLTRILRHAYDHVPYYRYAWDSMRIRPENIQTPEDFKRLPLLTKQQVREQAALLKADNAGGRPFYRFTSGSTGVPLGIIHSRQSRAAMWAAKYRGHRWNGVDVGNRTAWVRGMPMKRSEKFAKRIQDWSVNGVRLLAADITPLSVQAWYRRLYRFKPQLLEGYPSALYQVAKIMQELDLDGRMLGIRLIVTGGEILFDFQRAYLRDVFGCSVADEYGCAEIGILGFECPEGRRHIPVENVYIEIQSDTSGCNADASELIVTSLVNEAMPFIRYRLGDLGAIETQPCRCGLTAPSIAGLDGKVSSFIRTTEGRWIHDSVIRHLIYQIEERRTGVDQVRFTQEENASITVNIVRGKNFQDEIVKTIEKTLKAALGASLHVQVHFVAHITPKDSGKFCYFVSRLSTATREAGQVAEIKEAD